MIYDLNYIATEGSAQDLVKDIRSHQISNGHVTMWSTRKRDRRA
jgi:hypothetical protein